MFGEVDISSPILYSLSSRYPRYIPPGFYPSNPSVCSWKYLYGQGSCARYDISPLANDSASIYFYLASIQSIIPVSIDVKVPDAIETAWVDCRVL